MSDYCTKCGGLLERRSSPTGRFDPFSGTPTEHQWSVCPKWRRSRFLLVGNGHTWNYHGENRIDGGGPPDPGRYENPPSPSEVRS